MILNFVEIAPHHFLCSEQGIVFLYLACLHRKSDANSIRKCCCCETTKSEVFFLKSARGQKNGEENEESYALK